MATVGDLFPRGMEVGPDLPVVVPPGSQPSSLLCRLGRHRRERIEAVKPKRTGTLFNMRECMFARRVGPKWCDPAQQHYHEAVWWCSRCGRHLGSSGVAPASNPELDW